MRCLPCMRFLAVALTFAGAAAAHAQAGPPKRHVSLVLDCSKSMAAEFPAGLATASDADVLELTRLDAAKDVLQATLTRLSAKGNAEVALWLFGHRLAWSEGDEPSLLEQTEYLEAFLGFDILSKLMPGDDVELVFPSETLEPDDLEKIAERLRIVRPWGEDPLYLSMARAIESLPGGATSVDACLIVITDGDNRQWIAKQKGTKADVLEAIGRNRIPVHIISLGRGKESQKSAAELEQIAAQSRGSFQQAANAHELAERVEAVLKAAPSATAAALAELTGGGTDAPAQVAAGDASPAPPLLRTIEGKVTCYGKPVANATVTLDGAGLSSYVTDDDGVFRFEEVPAGEYELVCEAVYQNYRRDKTTAIKLSTARRDAAFVEVQLK